MFEKKQKTKQKHALTFISEDCCIKGELEITGDILLNGVIDGQLKSNGTITVGATGKLHGFLSASRVEIAGSVEGNLECNELHIEQSGVLQGDVICTMIDIDKGGQFFGQRHSQIAEAEVLAITDINRTTVAEG